jgi:hypothetical protein
MRLRARSCRRRNRNCQSRCEAARVCSELGRSRLLPETPRREPRYLYQSGERRQTSAVLDYDIRFDHLGCFSELVELFELEFKFVGVFRSRRGWCSKKPKLRVVANCFHRICQTIAGTCGSTTRKIRKAKHPLSFPRAGAQFWRRPVRGKLY